MGVYDEYGYGREEEEEEEEEDFLDESDFVSSFTTPSSNYTSTPSSSTTSLRLGGNPDAGFSITCADFVTAVLPNTTADYSFDLPRLELNQSTGGTLHVFVLPYRALQPHHVEWLVVSLDMKQPCIGMNTLFTDGMIAAVLMTTRTRCLMLRVDIKDGIPMDREARRQAEQERNRLLRVMGPLGRNDRKNGEVKDSKERIYRKFQQEILQRQTRGLKDRSTEDWYNKALELVLSNEEIAKVGWEIWFDALALYQFFGHKTGSAYDVSCLSVHRDRRELLDLFETVHDLYPDAPDTLERERLEPEQTWFDPDLAENQIRYAVMDVWAAYVCAMAAPKVHTELEARRSGSRTNAEHIVSTNRLPAKWNAIACLHLKQPPLSLPQIPEWKIEMCAVASVLARTITEYTGTQFEGEIRTEEQVMVSQDGKFKITNERYATRIRESDVVLIQTKSGEVLKGQAILTKGRKTIIELKNRASTNPSVLPPAILHIDDRPSGSVKKKRVPRPKSNAMLDIASVSVDVGQLCSNTDYARDCFAKQIISDKDRPLPLLIEAFFGSKDVSKRAIQRLKNHAIYGKGEVAEIRKAEIEGELIDCGRLNKAQYGAAKAIMVESNPVVLVQGPPGSGKTSCIVACLVAWHSTRPDYLPNSTIGEHESRWNDETILCVAKTNVAVKNMADKLERETNIDFRLVVSSEFYREWHESQYTPIQKNIVVTDDIGASERARTRLERKLETVHVYLCTLAQLSNKTKMGIWLSGKRVTHMIVDEASQIPLGEYLDPLSQLPELKKVAFFGDDCQLPPFGSHKIPGGVPSVFSIKKFRDIAHFLDTQYRMPAVISKFVSERVYQGYLQSDPNRNVLPEQEGPELLWVDVNEGLGEALRGTSFDNRNEAEAITRCVRSLVHSHPYLAANDYVVLTGYDAQRKLIQESLKEAQLPYERNVYNVDTYQGHECHTVIVSLTRTANVGFLYDIRRTNVMLTRAKVRMIVFGRTSFAVGSKCRRTLIGALALECRQTGMMIAEEAVGKPNWLADPKWRNSYATFSSTCPSEALEDMPGNVNDWDEGSRAKQNKRVYRDLKTADETDSDSDAVVTEEYVIRAPATSAATTAATVKEASGAYIAAAATTAASVKQASGAYIAAAATTAASVKQASSAYIAAATSATAVTKQHPEETTNKGMEPTEREKEGNFSSVKECFVDLSIGH